MKNFNKTTFFSYARSSPFGGRLTQEQVQGLNAIIDKFYKSGGTDPRHLAYMLATTFHETAFTMQPITERGKKAYFDKYEPSTKIGQRLGNKQAGDGYKYRGRGYVQITGFDNYARFSKILQKPLMRDPDLALDPDIAAEILFEGMMRGSTGKGDFTGKSLEDFFDQWTDDPIGARKIINGTDKAAHIAENYYGPFLSAINEALKQEVPEDVSDDTASPDKPNWIKDKISWGGGMGFAGLGGLSFFDGISGPWAFAAFALVAILAAAGIYFFVVGRREVAKKAGV